MPSHSMASLVGFSKFTMYAGWLSNHCGLPIPDQNAGSGAPMTNVRSTTT